MKWALLDDLMSASVQGMIGNVQGMNGNHNPGVGGSSPSPATNFARDRQFRILRGTAVVFYLPPVTTHSRLFVS